MKSNNIMFNISPLALICLFCGFLMISGCDDDDQVPSSMNTLEMNLDNLRIGNTFRYTLLKGERYPFAENNVFEYTGDTLELQVIAINDGTYKISEKITSNSNMRINGEDYYWEFGDSIYTNMWEIRNDSLFISSPGHYLESHLFGRSSFAFSPPDAMETSISGWKTTSGYRESDAHFFVRQYAQFGQLYDRLSIFINNRPMQVDGPGNTTVYSREHGIIRMTRYSWWTGTGYGWDKL